MKILFVGDLFGKPGRNALRSQLAEMRKGPSAPDVVIVNCENAAAGFGMTDKIMDEMFSWGVDAMTSGNHIWDKKEFVPTLSREPRVLRPANYPASAPGKGHVIVDRGGFRLCVVSLQGRAFMPAEIESPFETIDEIMGTVKADAFFIDFHAEATAEKIALWHYTDGRAAAVVGTHTHVQTADDTVSPSGTAYISDVGMTGGHAGVIGMRYESVLPKFLTSVPCRFEVENGGVRFQGAMIEIDDETAKACDIKRIDIPIQDEAP